VSTCGQILSASSGAPRSRSFAFLEGIIVTAALILIAAPSGIAQTQTPPACLMSGFWTGTYSGTTTDNDGNPVSLNGGVTAQFSQVGFPFFSGLVEAAAYEVPVPGRTRMERSLWGRWMLTVRPPVLAEFHDHGGRWSDRALRHGRRKF